MTAGALDAALERFARTGPEFGGGLSNHGPMASEALVALGREDAVLPWAEQYAARLREPPVARHPIAPDAWREALGDIGRVGDWTAFFRREVAGQAWADVLETWAARLAPGVMAGATHGIIRTAHAVRALEGGETRHRVDEFAAGLAYWAARYQPLPGDGAARGGMSVEAALARVPRAARQPGRMLIFEAVRELDERAFAPAIGLVRVDGGLDAFVTSMTRVFVRQFLANAAHAAIGFVHTVTAPSALRILVPHLSEDTAVTAARYTWQACAAIYATYGRSDAPVALAPYDVPGVDRDDLVERAIATRDEHAIKFTEACLREFGRSADGAYLVAAGEMVARLPGAS